MNWLADKIEQWPTAKLVPYARNARTHSDGQVAQIAASIAEFGFTNPILAGSDGVIVVDGFGGSGSTLIAADRMGMSARLMELDPKFVDVIVRRWQEYAGREAIHLATGATFDETAEAASSV